MRLFLLTALAMIGFAANSVLNRIALVGDPGAPAGFALIRLASGAAFLLVLLRIRRGGPVPWRAPNRLLAAAMLALYVLGFSFAYVTLDAGVGALILFGGVQMTMFAGAVLAGEAIAPTRWIGAGVSLAGLAWLLWPSGAVAPDPAGALLMGAAAFGWGVYSLLGRTVDDPLGATAVNFAWAVPAGLAALAIAPAVPGARSALLAVLSGAVTSGAGYALWYAVLPRLGAARAAIAQLSVPVIALGGGALALGEGLSTRLVASAALVLAGIALSLRC